MTASDDRRFMAAALRLARWNTGRTSTNPSVGCILVRDGAIVGTGVTAFGGRPHAEPQALAEVGDKARGATAYVTLEPCSHYGKTPPCANALIAAGVARVCVSVTDPDPRVSGRGVTMLREAGIAVETGLLEAEGRSVLSPYLTRQVEKRAHVTLKLAVSADDMIGIRGQGQVAITGPLARAQVHALRAEMDAILVGLGTAVADDPELTVRLAGLANRSPRRFVLDRRCRAPLTLKMVATAAQVPLTVVCCGCDTRADYDAEAFVSPGASGDLDGSVTRRAALASAGVTIWDFPADAQGGGPDLSHLLQRMAADGISSVMIEGGAEVAKSFLDAGLVDRLLLFQGPGTLGPDGLASPVTEGHMPAGYRLVARDVFGPDVALHYERVC